MNKEEYDIIKGDNLCTYLRDKADQHMSQFQFTLSSFEKATLWEKWCWFVHGIDDLINIRQTMPSEVYDRLKDKSISNVCLFPFILRQEVLLLERCFGSEVGYRFQRMMCIFSEMNMGWRCRNQSLFDTIDQVINYCELRRLHYVSVLYMIPLYCQAGVGKKDIEMDLLLNVIECNVISAMRFRSALIQCHMLSDFQAELYNDQVFFPIDYNQLEENGLEPIPYSYVDVLKYRSVSLENLRFTSPELLYAKVHLKDHLHNIPIYYQNYQLVSRPEYIQLNNLMKDLLELCDDDYSIKISIDQYDKLCKKYNMLVLYEAPTDYLEALELRTLFFKYHGGYYSTILFATRYLDNIVFSLLLKNKKYQIDSGFVFEDAVEEVLNKSGFIRLKDCKRINRKEFDVVCIKNGELYNFQCKNNYLDIRNMQIDVTSIVKGHRKLMSTYRRALKKEKNRESLLIEKYQIKKIYHFVVCRYPVVSDNPHIIPFNQLKNRLGSISDLSNPDFIG